MNKTKEIEFQRIEKIDIDVQPNGQILLGFRKASSQGHLMKMFLSADQARNLAQTLISSADRASQFALQKKTH